MPEMRDMYGVYSEQPHGREEELLKEIHFLRLELQAMRILLSGTERPEDPIPDPCSVGGI